jgi:hypothetical protein
MSMYCIHRGKIDVSLANENLRNRELIPSSVEVLEKSMEIDGVLDNEHPVHISVAVHCWKFYQSTLIPIVYRIDKSSTGCWKKAHQVESVLSKVIIEYEAFSTSVTTKIVSRYMKPLYTIVPYLDASSSSKNLIWTCWKDVKVSQITFT